MLKQVVRLSMPVKCWQESAMVQPACSSRKLLASNGTSWATCMTRASGIMDAVCNESFQPAKQWLYINSSSCQLITILRFS